MHRQIDPEAQGAAVRRPLFSVLVGVSASNAMAKEALRTEIDRLQWERNPLGEANRRLREDHPQTAEQVDLETVLARSHTVLTSNAVEYVSSAHPLLHAKVTAQGSKAA